MASPPRVSSTLAPTDVASLLSNTFSGWNYLDSINGPVVAVATRVRNKARRPESAHELVMAQLELFGRSNNIVQLTMSGTKPPSKETVVVQFYSTLFNQGQNGAFSSILNVRTDTNLLVPVTIDVKSPSGKVRFKFFNVFLVLPLLFFVRAAQQLLDQQWLI